MSTTIEPPTQVVTEPITQIKTAPGPSLLQGAIFGVIFGFLLQKGGVAKYDVLIGQLLLIDFTVVKIMLTAVVVGALGVHYLHSRGLVSLHLKPTRYASNILGGLIFGVGFALSGYCPGTGAAAVGQGNLDAISVIAGMVGGSYVFAEFSGWIARKIEPIGDRGKITIQDFSPTSRTITVVVYATVLIVVLVALEYAL
ncbi:MAG: YeeE/YedE family protein [Planctomycetales bacterium]|nr:YeeE/YedE family protein [Planctomycetales bacterium]